MINYNNLKIFNKHGNEIPLFYTSNLIFTTASDVELISDNDVVLYGFYDNNNKKEFFSKIIQPGKISSGIIKDDDVTLRLRLNCFVDGKLIDNTSAYIDLVIDNDIEKLYSTNYNNSSLDNDSLIANDKDDANYFYYTIKDLSNKVQCTSDIENLLFPSTIFIGNINIDRISTGLVETETLLFGTINNNKLNSLSFNDNCELKLILDSDDEYIRFLELDEYESEIIKLNSISLNNESKNYVNIGFFPDMEGVYEQKIYVCLCDENNIITKIGELNVISEAIGEDERYRALFDNFGIMNPSTYYSLFKSHDINEENIDWNLINKKSKELFLTYDQIFPYIGTYKALINAINFLGYDDIYFREWYKAIDKNGNYKNISYRINLNEAFNDRNIYEDDSIVNYKKLNKLSMIYKINQESGTFDKYDIPEVENVYSYSITEVLTKLVALKQWLERNIIAVNCKILEITGEGVIYEKQDYITYGTVMQNIEYEEIHEIDPNVENKIVELIDGSANINVSNIVSSIDNYIKIDELKNATFADFNNETIEYPFINNFIIKGYIDTSNAIISDNVTKPLWLNNGEIGFTLNKDVSVIKITDENDNEIINDNSSESDNIVGIISGNFIKESNFIKAPIIQIQRGYLRKDELDWDNNAKFTILPSTDKLSYRLICPNGNTYYSRDNIILYPMENASLKYTYNTSYGVPMFKLNNYKFIIYDNKNSGYLDEFVIDEFNVTEELILDIQDGKLLHSIKDNNKCIINFHYDEYNNGEQNVSVIYEYTAEHKYTPKIVDNNYYYDEYFTMNVNNIGHYNIVAYSFNENGNVFVKEIDGGCDVIINKTDINIYSDQEIHKNYKNFYHKDSIGTHVNIGDILAEYPTAQSNEFPIFRDNFKLTELSYGKKDDEQYIQYPNISYIIDTAKYGDYLYLQNIVDKFEYIGKDIKNQKDCFVFKLIGNIAHNVFPEVFKNINNTVNIVVYNKLNQCGVFEAEGELIELHDNKFYININSDVDRIDLLSYLDSNDFNYNYEYYIQPTTVYALKSSQVLDNNKTKLIISNINISDTPIFKAGDCVKLIYSMTKCIDANAFIKTSEINNPDAVIYHIESVDIDNNGTPQYKIKDSSLVIDYYVTDNNFYAEEKIDNEFVYIQYTKLYKTDADADNTYKGYATYRIDEIGNDYIIVDDLFNYNIYDILNVLAKIPEDVNIDKELISDISNYYIIRYKDDSGNLLPVITKDYRTIKIGSTTYTINPIISDLKIAKAHQAYVNYSLVANHSEEYFNSYNRVYTNNNILYSYLDNSFSMIISKFDKNVAYNLWNYNYIQPDKLYLHKNPIVINRTGRLKENENDYPQIILTSKLKDQKDNYTYWKVYLKKTDGSRKLLGEFMNNKLVLDLKYLGIYDIEAYNYDEYGNLSITERESYIAVI